MGDPVSTIRHDYHAAHHSGTRPESAIRYIVVHDGEAPSPTDAAEGMGRWFENPKSGGSTHFGVDNDSTQQYLPLTAVSWGAPPLNDHGVHIECAGMAKYDRATWLAKYTPMLERLGWLLAHLHKQLGIPLHVLTLAELKAAGTNPSSDKGIVTHAEISAAYHQTTHTDPGRGFPMDVVMRYAIGFAGETPKPKPKPHVEPLPPLKRGSKDADHVRVLQKALKAHGFHDPDGHDLAIDGDFGPDTEHAVKDCQGKANLKRTGVVTAATWKALGK